MKPMHGRLMTFLLAASMLGLVACGGTEPVEDVADAPGAAAVEPSEDANAPDAEEAAAVDVAAEEDATEPEAVVDEAAAPAEDEAAGETGSGMDGTAATPAKLDLNSASAEELAMVPAAGDRMVREFLEYRPYVSITQFRRELGKYIGEAQIAAYEEYLYVPVSPNESDEATLQQLPGVDGTVAAELVAGRPYASSEAFLAELASWVGEEDAAAAAAYLAAP